jgi:hypothetical protein
MIKSGDKVYIKGEGKEIFKISQIDEERRRCWVGDLINGAGWYCFFSQLIPVDGDPAEYDDEEEEDFE